MNEAIKKVTDIPERVKLVAINHLFKQIDQYTGQMEKEMRELNYKYELIQKPLLEKQQTIIQGGVLEKEEVEGLEDYLKEEEKEKVEDALKDSLSIPQYWLKCMQNAEISGNEITQKDVPCLKHLQSIKFRSEDNEENKKG